MDYYLVCIFLNFFAMTNSTASPLPLQIADMFPLGNPFLDGMGVEFVHAAGGKAELALTLRPDHMNSWHVTHGGVSMTMMDVAMALAGRTLSPTLQSCVTVDMSTKFLQPGGKPGERLIASATAFYRSATLCFCVAEVHNGSKLVAHGTGTFKYLKRLDQIGTLVGPGTTEN